MDFTYVLTNPLRLAAWRTVLRRILRPVWAQHRDSVSSNAGNITQGTSKRKHPLPLLPTTTPLPQGTAVSQLYKAPSAHGTLCTRHPLHSGTLCTRHPLHTAPSAHSTFCTWHLLHTAALSRSLENWEEPGAQSEA